MGKQNRREGERAITEGIGMRIWDVGGERKMGSERSQATLENRERSNIEQLKV
jgi:hypothetical protein